MNIVHGESKWERRKRAMEEGAVARSGGLDLDRNPYQKTEWGLGTFWEMGYRQQEERERRGMDEPHPRFRGSDNAD